MSTKKTKFDSKMLDNILEKMMSTVETSKDEIFRIGEQSRKEFESLADELKSIKPKVLETIEEGDRLEGHAKFARKRLSEVSKHFKNYSEDEIREAYEKAHSIQMELTVIRQREKQLRNRRDEIERRLVGLQETIERAEALVGQISVVLNYLDTDLRAVGDLIEDAKQKQDFGLRIIEAQEDERRRLSREIHDGPAQMLANVMMRSDLVERVYRERGGEEAMEEIRSLRKMVRNALYEVRRIIYDLRPMALDDLGLVPTLAKYLDTIEDYHKQAEIKFVHFGIDKRLPSRLEVALFRLIQEAVQNATKHADASEISVKLEIQRNQIIAIIKDNGKGFDIEQTKEKSFGLIGMRERVELLEGQLTVDSKVGSGTIIIISVPLNV
ncbi:sensor histidine kinase [Bacillus suaedaesalsae]|uniref:Signal transduction histidine-protein kinase/phosphatase DegS n=1 Tax=Bacillus suaedaesalsae TaxID=2810349 RepID=A0ABS2DNH1_9BACI|nr:histidine kinase [Bacillus suaedaesalsae]MBM6619063.1 histidine kinase [Bacillus suaedaesalsae]